MLVEALALLSIKAQWRLRLFHAPPQALLLNQTLRPNRERFPAFDSQSDCLRWIMKNRAYLNRTLPQARIRAVALDRWLLGLE